MKFKELFILVVLVVGSNQQQSVEEGAALPAAETDGLKIDQQPQPIESQPPAAESQPQPVENQPQSFESQPPPSDSQPPPVESQPRPIEYQPPPFEIPVAQPDPNQPFFIGSPPKGGQPPIAWNSQADGQPIGGPPRDGQPPIAWNPQADGQPIGGPPRDGQPPIAWNPQADGQPIGGPPRDGQPPITWNPSGDGQPIGGPPPASDSGLLPQQVLSQPGVDNEPFRVVPSEGFAGSPVGPSGSDGQSAVVDTGVYSHHEQAPAPKLYELLVTLSGGPTRDETSEILQTWTEQLAAPPASRIVQSDNQFLLYYYDEDYAKAALDILLNKDRTQEIQFENETFPGKAIPQITA